MEEALSQLACNGERDFLHTSRIFMSLLQNVLDDPSNAGHRRIRSTSKVRTAGSVPGDDCVV